MRWFSDFNITYCKSFNGEEKRTPPSYAGDHSVFNIHRRVWLVTLLCSPVMLVKLPCVYQDKKISAYAIGFHHKNKQNGTIISFNGFTIQVSGWNDIG